jgi:hypothetical protein
MLLLWLWLADLAAAAPAHLEMSAEVFPDGRKTYVEVRNSGPGTVVFYGGDCRGEGLFAFANAQKRILKPAVLRSCREGDVRLIHKILPDERVSFLLRGWVPGAVFLRYTNRHVDYWQGDVWIPIQRTKKEDPP